MSRTTKAQLQAEVEALRHNCDLLETEIASLKLRLEEPKRTARAVSPEDERRTAYREYTRNAKECAMRTRSSVLIKGYAAWCAAQ